MQKTRLLQIFKDFLREIDEFKQADHGSFELFDAGSGFRTTSSGPGMPVSDLGWALVEIPQDRVGENMVRIFPSSLTTVALSTLFLLSLTLTPRQDHEHKTPIAIRANPGPWITLMSELNLHLQRIISRGLILHLIR